jgi:RNA polymerase sigma factor for flagellar operon FliA
LELPTKEIRFRSQPAPGPRSETSSVSDGDAREALVSEYSPLVGRIVRKIAWCLPAKIEMADLMGAAWLGLLDAAAKFDPEKSLRFEPYARIRIQGAIQDELRTLDWVPRSVRRQLSEITRTSRCLEQELGRAAREEEVAEALGIGLHEYWRITEIARLVDLMQKGESEDAWVHISPGFTELGSSGQEGETLGSTEVNSLWVAIEHALPELPPNEQTVLRLHYFEGKKLKEIGQVLSLSESRISQVRTKALRTLRSRFQSLLES